MEISETEGFDFKTFIENLGTQGQEYQWRPFPDHYVNTRPHVDSFIPQISNENQQIHVIAKLTDNFEILQQYGLDEDTTPPKVLCWNDISSLTTKMAAKTVKAGLEREYTSINSQITIKFQTEMIGNKIHLLMPDQTPNILVYHVLDPTITQQRKLRTNSINRLMVSSFSTSHLNSMAENAFPSIPRDPSGSDINSLTQHVDSETLNAIMENNPQQNTIFIFDCSFAKRSLKFVRSNEKKRKMNNMIFAATSNVLTYSPHLPCDLFTSCLLTPSKVALLWQSQRVGHFKSGILNEIDIQTLIDELSDSTQSKNILEMIENALNAIADKIALDILISEFSLFNEIFRKDSFTARLFYNFMFAMRVMSSLAMKPSSYPKIPDMTQHPLWNTFDLQVDRALYSLANSFSPKKIPKSLFILNDLLSEGIGRLESWLRFPQKGRKVPNEICYLPMLLQSKEYFPYAINFCSNFIQISDNTAKIFLYTRSFPELPGTLKFLENSHPATIAAFSFVVADSVLLVPDLKVYFHDKTSFWFQYVTSDYDQLIIGALSCLLVFLDNEEQVELYRDNNIVEMLQPLVTHSHKRVRCLSNLILAQLKDPIEPESGLLQTEKSPLCRAALVSRLLVTMETMDINDMANDAIFFDIIAALDDLCPIVREEALVVISQTIQREPHTFIEALAKCLKDSDFRSSTSPIPPILGSSLRAMLFETSLRVNERLIEFFNFLAKKIEKNDNSTLPLKSNLTYSCLRKLAHTPSYKDDAPTLFNTEILISESSALVGKPDISPSGLFTCGDNSGRIFCQFQNEEIGSWRRHRELYECFKPAFNMDKISKHFHNLQLLREKQKKPNISYLKFIDDNRILVVSSKAQVVVLDSHVLEDSACSFWADHPDKCEFSIADYNNHSFSLIQTSNTGSVRLFDIETHQRIDDYQITEDLNITGMQWLKPYTTLFYVAQNDIDIFDTRMKRPVTVIHDAGKKFIGGNISHNLPIYLVMGHEQGITSMYDMRTMSKITSRTYSKSFKEFDVHKHLPFGVAISDALVSFNFESGLLLPQSQNLGFVPQSISLHHSESLAAARVGNKVMCAKIMYSNL